MIVAAMQSPEQFVLQVTYLAADGTVTDRAVSPLGYLTKDRLRVYCLGREGVRTLKVGCILKLRLRFTIDVLCPEAIGELVSHHKRLRLDKSTETAGRPATENDGQERAISQ